MSYGVRLHVWGDYACFTRPEMKVERVSYDVMTPSAARGILEAIHWKPAILWQVDRIHVLKPIRFQTIRRNEVNNKISESTARSAMKRGDLKGLSLSAGAPHGTQRSTTLLRHVAYVIEAHFTLTDKAGPEDTEAKHISMFNRRAETGQCFHRPCLGTREFAANFALVPEGALLPVNELPEADRNRDLGWMLHDIDFAKDNTSRFFRGRLEDGVLNVAKLVAEGLTA
ncbi:type I-C CRISPR-associated protein Cas5c [Acidiphilium sp. AL]|uniref:pre-crRNA processing endonuclease n=1 Tax=Acidiphilium iwatense TaxID=768198 RepID=A0ABS9DWI9_9PROT|nr:MULTISPECIES: type I-C CRISPR-associated protein Cas5c [Acidiphilium]MCF3947108.1 type I-C CRISPR-associated protein Cas5c [Acidiphilium iwatense]MCU4160591.1 type I-C CRISPR-associated protein Cas5c [Acidiphilium sp. AL]